MAKTFQEWVAEIQAANPNDWLGGEWLDGAGGGWEAGWTAAIDAAMAECGAEEYLYMENADECDRHGNVHGGTSDVQGALACRATRDRIAKLKE